MVRQVLRVLGSRYGMALVLLVLVLAAVGVARAVSDHSPASPVVAPPPTTGASGVGASGPDASAGSSEALSDDSVNGSESPQAPIVSPGADAPEVVALKFANAWLRTKGVSSAAWLKGMQPYLTQRVIDLLADTSPEKVPATDVRGPVELGTRSATLVEANVPVNPGTLRLRLIVNKGRWLVDSVDWERPS
jgi:hypothetical protein